MTELPNSERLQPDFSKALKLQESIIATELFLYGGDPSAVGQAGLMRERQRREAARALAARKRRESADSGKVVGTIDLSESPVAGLISDNTEES